MQRLSEDGTSSNSSSLKAFRGYRAPVEVERGRVAEELVAAGAVGGVESRVDHRARLRREHAAERTGKVGGEDVTVE
jgi:hypothetical protein